MMCFDDSYRGRSVLVTGHTGFKGSWLVLWLQMLGANVTAVSLPPVTSPNHWDLLGLQIEEYRLDIRDADRVREAISESKPEIVFHLAAQALVKRSHHEPLETWSTNVMGTANILDACRHSESVRAVVVVTTDKVYENREWFWGYRETDRLGGNDSYSGSKAAAELVTESYRRIHFSGVGSPLLATVRSGNVIGGGDWSEDRLIPDAVRALAMKEPLAIRSPRATRPWQHVLECLNGYLMLGQKLLEGKAEFAGAWNFGPDSADSRTVSDVLSALKVHWPRLEWSLSQAENGIETGLLHLDNTKAKSLLGWRPVWRLEEALELTAEWYRMFVDSGSVVSREQLIRFINDAARSMAAVVP